VRDDKRSHWNAILASDVQRAIAGVLVR
jgi:hypothetical protein